MSNNLAPTEEQQEIIEAVAQSATSLMINAYAGCAKTTSLALLGKKVKGPALALAFNKSIAEELKGRFSENFEVKTMNSFGFGALRSGLPKVTKWNLEPKKLGKLISDEAKAWKLQLSGDEWDAARKLVTAAMLVGIKPNGQMDREAWADLAEEQFIPRETFELIGEMSYEVLKKNNKLTEQGTISFDDQIYYPVVFGLRFPQFPTMLVDEAQDLSSLQHEMLKLSSGKGRLIVCGDSKQAIYGFRGAHSHSMAEIMMLKNEWTPKKLTLTFRCPKKVVERQQQHAPGFRAFHLNAEGVSARFEPTSVDQEMSETWEGWNYLDIVKVKPSERSTVAILCRNNGPLFSIAFKLIRSGVGVVMLGRELGKGLNLLVKKLTKEPETPIDVLLGKLTEWLETETTMAMANGHEEKVSGFVDRAECIRAVASGAGCRTSGDVIAQIDRLFAKESGQVTLASIHKSKGLEWDMVVHLDPWRVPSKQARKAALKGDESQLIQEWNLKYVCETRTKHTLIEANLDDFNAGD